VKREQNEEFKIAVRHLYRTREAIANGPGPDMMQTNALRFDQATIQ
jgi:hypothetical protein